MAILGFPNVIGPNGSNYDSQRSGGDVGDLQRDALDKNQRQTVLAGVEIGSIGVKKTHVDLLILVEKQYLLELKKPLG